MRRGLLTLDGRHDTTCVIPERLIGRPDAGLVSAARDGDREAFAELISRHRQTALAVLVRMLGSEDLSGDAVQEATLIAMTSPDRLRSPESFGAWLCGIALNVARRWLRELRWMPLTSCMTFADDAASPDELVEAAEMAAAVRHAIAGLADGRRDAVLLFYLHGLTHREVAAELAISVGAVKSRLHQARTALAPTLAEGTFYATVVVEGPAGAREVDGRPSDALNLALVTGSPSGSTIRCSRTLELPAGQTGRTIPKPPPISPRRFGSNTKQPGRSPLLLSREGHLRNG